MAFPAPVYAVKTTYSKRRSKHTASDFDDGLGSGLHRANVTITAIRDGQAHR